SVTSRQPGARSSSSSKAACFPAWPPSTTERQSDDKRSPGEAGARSESSSRGCTGSKKGRSLPPRVKMRTPLVVGNWKMHCGVAEARELARSVRDGLKRPRGMELMVCPPFTAIAAVADVLAGSPVGLGAQNCHWEPQGAFTGEVSPPMLAELGCRLVLLGHSERRHRFRETDDEINRKVLAALRPV